MAKVRKPRALFGFAVAVITYRRKRYSLDVSGPVVTLNHREMLETLRQLHNWLGSAIAWLEAREEK